ncbi:MAG: hypothetical protein WAT23_11300 [Chromatiaceae bacterium]
MNQDFSEQAGDDGPQYLERTPADYLDTLPSELRSSFSEPQLAAVQHLLAAAMPKPSPKLVDLRFWVDFLAYRYYVVFFVGKDRRDRERPEPVPPMARKGNAVTALLLLIGLNLLISLSILLIVFVIKSVIGYSLLPHSDLSDQVHRLN